MSSKKNGNKAAIAPTRTMSKPRKRAVGNETSVDRNKTKKDEKIGKIPKKPTIEDDAKPTIRPIIKTKEPIIRKSNVGSSNSRKLGTTQKRPTTPPSKRVTKTQFFPSKSMYAQALKKQENQPKTTVVSSKNRDISPDSSSISERPRTATLRRASIVHNNIAGPEVVKPPQNPITTEQNANTTNYDDDFDSYESDFDEYHSSDSTTVNISEISTGTESESTSSGEEFKSQQKCSIDDEKKLDSGNYELPELKQKRFVLDNIKEMIENENNTGNHQQNYASLSDEGFEDTKSSSLQFINFIGAQQKSQKRKTMEQKRKRGEAILNMIKLDIYNFTLFDMPPVPYEDFIKTFGKQNTIQISTQTGDNGLDEDAQTDLVIYENKWTQYPPVYERFDPTSEQFWQLSRANYLGVGGDLIGDTPKFEQNPPNLNKFIINAGNLIRNLQIENHRRSHKSHNKFDNLPTFSQNCILYKTETVQILRDRTIINASFARDRILLVHSRRDDDERSIVSVWRIGNVDQPEFLLCTFGETTCCTSSSQATNLIFAGLNDGTIVVWDTKEPISFHSGVDNCGDLQLRTSTYSSELQQAHNTRIIALLSLTKQQLNDELFATKSKEICSLDENGLLIIWGVIKKTQQIVVNNHTLAPWGQIVLTINTKIDLQRLHPEIDDFKCTDLSINQLDPKHLYIATNYGFIIHCLTTNAKPKVRKFVPKFESKANCLEMCPFSSRYFIAGFDDGNLNFYTNHLERPLMILSDKNRKIDECQIDFIQWSHNRPLIFYIKDIQNTIHVWDLNTSDVLPVNSIRFDQRIVSMKLSPIALDNRDDTYMMIATENGSIYLYQLGGGHEQIPSKEYEEDKNKFLNYIDRYV